ncbi:hypothetical protein MPAR168_18485 [Methylorubrum populi]|uniref:Uncharacterized protein n=1 Tax=Methylobacterium radiotolerans TaxID=31998 RepID=A0ABU7T6E1_9HYPH
MASARWLRAFTSDLIRSLGAAIQGRDLSASSSGEPVEATEAEILPEDLRRMSDPSFTPGC